MARRHKRCKYGKLKHPTKHGRVCKKKVGGRRRRRHRR